MWCEIVLYCDWQKNINTKQGEITEFSGFEFLFCCFLQEGDNIIYFKRQKIIFKSYPI